MELAVIQKSLALFYTDSKLRSRFFANPLQVQEELGLSEQKVLELSTLSPSQVNLFATSLKHKRLGEVRELLPLTAWKLGKKFNSLFWQYAETYMPEGIRKHHNDAIAFATFIVKNAEIAASDRL
ncbi:MAG: hypothetical protein KME17_16910 [Cyanosarcina radialis HA8281-LM2]|jgi:hypothetical protein|nr:hypothetical protein [Cyanosarcina radialis HA8281-LM2]